MDNGSGLCLKVANIPLKTLCKISNFVCKSKVIELQEIYDTENVCIMKQIRLSTTNTL